MSKLYIPVEVDDIEEDEGELTPELAECISRALNEPDIPFIPDNINKPQHYVLPVPAIDCFSAQTQLGLLDDHCVATAFAYLWRCKLKNQYISDLKKVRWYVNKAIELYDSKEQSTEGNRAKNE